MEGNNSEIVKEIMRDVRLSHVFMDWVEASAQDKEKFEFVRYADTGSLDIIDNRPKNKTATVVATTLTKG